MTEPTEHASWHRPASPEALRALDNALSPREPGCDDDMKSIGEVMGSMGWKPKPVIGDADRPPEHWQRLIDEHWLLQRPKIWLAMLANGVPPLLIGELQRMRLDGRTPVQSQAVTEAVDWERSKEPLCALIGVTYRGKSFACASMLSNRSKLIRSQYGTEPWLEYRYVDSDFRWLRASTIANLRDRFDAGVRAAARKLETARLLVIDEVGGASITDVSKQIQELIAKRFDAGLRTLMTGNLNYAELGISLGDRIMSRLDQHGRIVECRDWRQLDGPDLRRTTENA
jgi:hypothetical protein